MLRERTQGPRATATPAKPTAKPAKPTAKPAARLALPPGRPGGALAGGALAIRPSGLLNRALVLPAIAGQIADIKGGFEKLANHPFLKGKGGKPTPSAGRRTNPKDAKPKPKLADIRGTSKSKFADLRGSSKPGGSAPAAARELPKPTPKPKPSSATTPTRSSAPARSSAAASRPVASRPAATPAKAKPPAASKPTVAQTSGIGPVKSGDEYARKKGSLREQARKLREMQAESRKRQGK
jgi:hypothetical protein